MIRERILSRANRGTADRSRNRMAEKGGVDINQVDQALYRPDLGFKVTDTGYDKFKEGEATFGKDYEEVMSSNREALATNQGLLKQIGDYEESTKGISYESLYEGVKKDFVPVKVLAGNLPYNPEPSAPYDPENTNWAENQKMMEEAQAGLVGVEYVEDKYGKKYKPGEEAVLYTVYLPKEVVDQLDTSMNKEGSYNAMRFSDGYYIGDSPRGAGGSRYGKELADTLYGAEKQVQASFYENITPKLQEMQQGLAQAQQKKGEIQQYITTSEGNIQQAEAQKQLRETTKEAYKDQYESSVSQRQALFRPWA